MACVSSFGGVTFADFRPGEWQVFDNKTFVQFRDEGVQEANISKEGRTYAPYTNASKTCHLCDDSPRYLADMVSRKLYLNRPEGDIQDRFCVMAALIPIIGVVLVVGHVAISLLKVLFFYAFWKEGKWHSLREGVKGWGEDLFRLIATPLSLIAAQGIALYGMARPKDGMKAWTTLGQVAFDSNGTGVFFNPFSYASPFDFRPHDHIEGDLCLGDFCPVNQWKKEDSEETKYYFGNKRCRKCPSETHQMIRDETTGRLYFNDLPSVIRTKGVAMLLFTLIIHPIALTCNIAFRVLKIISLYSFWRGLGETETSGEKKPYNFKGRFQQFTADIFRIALAPLILPALFLSAVYMWIRPKDGKKLYAAFVRAEYGRFLMEPCLHPGFKTPHRDYKTLWEFIRLEMGLNRRKQRQI